MSTMKCDLRLTQCSPKWEACREMGWKKESPIKDCINVIQSSIEISSFHPIFALLLVLYYKTKSKACVNQEGASKNLWVAH